MSTTQNPFDFRRLEELISVSKHNPTWGTWYVEEVTTLASALTFLEPRFEHVGSSAVTGLKSKPIVDIMMGLNDLNISPDAQAAIVSLGYEYFGRLHPTQDRLFARKRGERSFNLQVVPYGAKEWEEKIVFRDYLRNHPDEVVLYSKIKDEALSSGNIQLIDYHRHKDRVVTAILDRALSWSSTMRQPCANRNSDK